MLWRGRFVFIQMRADWYEFEDKSGGELRVIIRAYDRRTGYYKDYIMDYAPWLYSFDWHLFTDEMVTNGEIVDTNVKNITKPLELMEKARAKC